MHNFTTIQDIVIKGKILFIRCDMNVPLKDGSISDISRIVSSLETINYALEQDAKVIIATHLGRPKEGTVTDKDSVAPIIKVLEQRLKRKIPLITNLDQKINFDSDQIVMLENVRCNIGEQANDDQLGQKYAKLCDIFVHDAFATAHRAESSTDAIGRYVDIVCAGILMARELKVLNEVTTSAKSPVTAIIGGSKVSTKLQVLHNLLSKVDTLILGGGILNTFILAKGYSVGSSLVEEELINDAVQILKKANELGVTIPLPSSVKVATKFSEDSKAILQNIQEIKSDEMILDISDEFAHDLAKIIAQSKTIIWNGPVGVFELSEFMNGTQIIAKSIGDCPGYTVAGGGDTIAAINKFKLTDKIDYISTAGGAMIEFLEGKELCAIKLLKEYASKPNK